MAGWSHHFRDFWRFHRRHRGVRDSAHPDAILADNPPGSLTHISIHSDNAPGFSVAHTKMQETQGMFSTVSYMFPGFVWSVLA
jgi:hypothetical protein